MSRTELTARAAVLSRRLEEVHPVMLPPVLALLVVMAAVVALAMVIAIAAVVLAFTAGITLVGLERTLSAAALWRPKNRAEVAR
ncbi:hypothetical protein [Streptomyces sp. NPDC056690]|uniref:hypothetical protein n=1 Tax=Streptomyces sp. NPDC056690 TaxID=3345912 RepID=UPI0036867582